MTYVFSCKNVFGHLDFSKCAFTKRLANNVVAKLGACSMGIRWLSIAVSFVLLVVLHTLLPILGGFCVGLVTSHF